MFVSPAEKAVDDRVSSTGSRVTVFILLPVLCHGFSTAARWPQRGFDCGHDAHLYPRRGRWGTFVPCGGGSWLGLLDRTRERREALARRTMACIDRLNYRDIGVIKAPLCWSLFYEGDEEIRDLTPGVRILAFPRRVPPLDSSVWFSSRTLCHFPAFLGNALLISYYPAGDASSADRRGVRSIAWGS